MSLTSKVNDLNKRVGALESSNLDENAPVSNIAKIYRYIYIHPIYCSEDLVCSEETVIGDDTQGTIDYLMADLTYIALGTGMAPALGDTIIQSEQIRKQVTDTLIDGNTLISEAYFDETEGNGLTYTNTGIFGQGASAAANSGILFIGEAINCAKDATRTLTVGYEITIAEV